MENVQQGDKFMKAGIVVGAASAVAITIFVLRKSAKKEWLKWSIPALLIGGFIGGGVGVKIWHNENQTT